MLGYYRKAEATAEAIDSDGFFHTGDIGEITTEGYLKITDRKKDLLVMSNGKKVAPQAVEHRLNASSLIEQAVVVGDDHKFIAALIYPAYPQLQVWLSQQGIKDSPAELPRNQQFVDFMQKEVDRCCEGMSHYEVVKKIAILPAELSQDGGELTPTLKVKRKVVLQKYAEQVAALYA
jgi:long-chain acyl-CoA synthetase